MVYGGVNDIVSMQEIGSVLFAVAVGYTAGGLIGSLHQAITRRPASFANLGEGTAERLWSALVIVLGGPVILMRNALRGRLIERRPAPWLAASTALATGWSFASGVVLLQFALGA